MKLKACCQFTDAYILAFLFFNSAFFIFQVVSDNNRIQIQKGNRVVRMGAEGLLIQIQIYIELVVNIGGK